MAKKQFKAESKRLMDLMINSIYTHKEIFLREIISNASDALDKLAYRGLTDDSVTVKRKDLQITLVPDKASRTLTVSDNGIGMTKEDLENNLGTIAKSGSRQFKADLAEGDKAAEKIDVIGQFGVPFVFIKNINGFGRNTISRTFVFFLNVLAKTVRFEQIRVVIKKGESLIWQKLMFKIQKLQ